MTTPHGDDGRPLIMLTNDDGVASPGLHAAVQAAAPLGDLLVVAPKRQQTAAGRSFPPGHMELEPYPLTLADGTAVETFALDGSPAQAVRAGLMLLAGRTPDLLISGINFGENVGVGVTISGTVGAAIEAATLGVPSLAASLETAIDHHHSISEQVDFSTAAYFTRMFAHMMLDLSLPPHTDLLKLDVPAAATPQTGWRVTRVSRQNFFVSIVAEEDGYRRFNGYQRSLNIDRVEPDSDIYALVVDQVVSLSPMTIDLTAREDLAALAAEVRTVLSDGSRNG